MAEGVEGIGKSVSCGRVVACGCDAVDMVGWGGFGRGDVEMGVIRMRGNRPRAWASPADGRSNCTRRPWPPSKKTRC